MTPEEYRRQQAAAWAATLRAIVGLFRLLPPRPSPGVWRAFIEALYPSVYRGRVDAWRVAERFYRGQRSTHLPDVPVAEVIIEFPSVASYPPEALDVGLSRVVRPRLEALEPGSLVPQTVVAEASAVVERHVADAGREAIVSAARRDPEALGYARVASGESTCAFCLMLVSRGPVYKSADAALLRDGTSEPYHDRCDCIAVPVFRRASWPGRAAYLQAARAWRDHANGSLREFRRWVEGRERAEQAEESAA